MARGGEVWYGAGGEPEHCPPGSRVLAYYAGLMGNAQRGQYWCRPDLPECWFEGTAAGQAFDPEAGQFPRLEVDWADGDRSFRRVPAGLAYRLSLDASASGAATRTGRLCADPAPGFFDRARVLGQAALSTASEAVAALRGNASAFLRVTLGIAMGRGLADTFTLPLASMLALRFQLLAVFIALEALGPEARRDASVGLELPEMPSRGPASRSAEAVATLCFNEVHRLGWDPVSAHQRGWQHAEEQLVFAPVLARYQLLFACADLVCVTDLSIRSDFEMRSCAGQHLANALVILKRQRLWRAASEFVEQAQALGCSKWQLMHQTPVLYVPGLDARGLWKRGDDEVLDRIAAAMEANFAAIRADVAGLLAQPWAHDDEFIAYPFLLGEGTWHKWSFFSHRTWNRTLCTAMPGTCGALRQLLPSWSREIQPLPYLVSNDEEVVLFETSPGSHVLPHRGGSNSRLNLHMGIAGLEGSELLLYGLGGDVPGVGRRFTWEEGKAGPAFDDSFDHEVITPATASRSRFILAVGILHPDLRTEPWRYAAASNRRTEVDNWSEEQQRHLQALATTALLRPAPADPGRRSGSDG